MKKRIVITGYGVINALGKGKEAVEKRLFDGEVGLSRKVFSSKSVEVEYQQDENNPNADNQLDAALEQVRNKINQ